MVAVIMILYKNTKAMVDSPKGNADFDIVVEDTFVSLMFLICLYYLRQTSVDLMKENDFILKKSTRNRRYSTETIIDADKAAS